MIDICLLTDDDARHLLQIVEAQIDGYAHSSQPRNLASAKRIHRAIERGMRKHQRRERIAENSML